MGRKRNQIRMLWKEPKPKSNRFYAKPAGIQQVKSKITGAAIFPQGTGDQEDMGYSRFIV